MIPKSFDHENTSCQLLVYIYLICVTYLLSKLFQSHFIFNNKPLCLCPIYVAPLCVITCSEYNLFITYYINKP